MNFFSYFKILTLVQLIITIASCGASQKLKVLNNKNAAYNQYQFKDKAIRYAGTTKVGQPQFYSHLKYVISKSKNEGYVLFYENIDLSNLNDEELRKVRKLFGFIPTDSGYANKYKPLISRGYTTINTASLLGDESKKAINVDITGKELIAAYEAKYGPITLTEKDKNTPLNKSMKPKDPESNLDAVLLSQRSVVLANKIANSDNNKILILFDSRNEQGVIDELKKFKDSIVFTNTFSTKELNDSNISSTIEETKQISHIDTIHNGYVLTIKNYVNVKAQLINKLELFSLDSRGTNYDVYTNYSTAIRFSADYGAFSGWYTFTPDFFQNNNDEDVYGNTSGFSFGFSIINTKWYSDYNFRYIKGFYLDNSDEVYPGNYNADQKLIKPELYYAALSANIGYKFNDRLSLRAIKSQTEIQQKSAGSFLLDGRVKYYEVQDGSQPRFDSISKTLNFEVGSTIGYVYTWVPIKNFYLSLGLNAGFGINIGKATRIENEIESTHRETTPVYIMSGNGTLGYNSERLYLGAYTNFNAGSFLNEVPFYDTGFNNLYTLFIGYRFVPKKLRN